MASPNALFQLSRAITVRYSARDAGSGVAAYDVRYRVAAWNGGFGGYVQPLGWRGTTATSARLTGSPGREYCFSVRARDNAKNQSGWSAERCTAIPLDDRSLSAVTAGWVRGTAASAYQHTLTTSDHAGARLKLGSVHARRIALVVTECATCGKVAIYLGGSLWRTVATHSATRRTSVILLEPPFGLRAAAVVLKATSSARVVIDGLGVRLT